MFQVTSSINSGLCKTDKCSKMNEKEAHVATARHEDVFVRTETLILVFIPELLRLICTYLGSDDIAIRFTCKIAHFNLRDVVPRVTLKSSGLYKYERNNDETRCALPYVTSINKLLWARDTLCMPVSRNVCVAAVQAGSLDVLDFLYHKERPTFPWDVTFCRFASIFGHLHVLKWARAQSPPCAFGAHVCMNAAYTNRLDILQWAKSQGCDWYLPECIAAARHSSIEMQEWLKSHDVKVFDKVAKACPLSFNLSASLCTIS